MLKHPDLKVTLEQDIGRCCLAVEALEIVRSEDVLQSPEIQEDDIRRLETDVRSNSDRAVSEDRPRISGG